MNIYKEYLEDPAVDQWRKDLLQYPPRGYLKKLKKIDPEDFIQIVIHELYSDADYNRGEANPWYGSKHSEETKRKIAEIARTRIHSKEERKAKSERMKGKGNPMYGVKRPKHAESLKKKVKVDGVIYNSMSEAANANDVSCACMTGWVKRSKAILL